MNRYIAIFLFLLCTLLFFPNSQFRKALAQSPSNNKNSNNINLIDLARPAMTVFKDSDGLPQSTVSKLAVDSKGYLWAITSNGIAYYNGHKWTTVDFPEKKLLKFLGYVGFIKATSDGSIWIGVPDVGMFQLKDGNWTLHNAKTGLPSEKVTTLLETKSPKGDSIIWIGSSDGLTKLENGQWTSLSAKPNTSFYITIYSLLETKSPKGDSIIWIGSSDGLTKLENGKITKLDLNFVFPDIAVFDLLETKSSKGDSIIWVGTNEGLLKLENGQWTRFDSSSGLPSKIVRSLLKTKSVDGNFIIWVGTNEGLSKFENEKWIFLGSKTDKANILNKRINSLLGTIASGESSTVWAATENGLVRLQNGLVKILDTKQGLPINDIYSLLETKDSVGNSIFWFGFNNGLAKFESGKWNTISIDVGLPNNGVLSLLETKTIDGKSSLWVGTSNGLIKFENEKWIKFASNNTSFNFERNEIISLLETKTVDGKFSLWVGTRNGLVKFEDGKWIKFDDNDFVSSSGIVNLLETKNLNGDSIIWVGTDRGLIKFENGEWTKGNIFSALENGFINCLYESKQENGDHILWAGTEEGAYKLNLSSPSGKWENFSNRVKVSLLDGTINQIYEDNQQRIYFFTDKGAVCLSKHSSTPESSSEYDIQIFTTKDGLPSNQFAFRSGYIKDSKGRIWGKTLEGIVIFDPSQEMQKLSPKPLYIESAMLTESKKNITENELLNYNQNNIEFEYALLSLVGEHKTLYKTQLLGLEEKASEWLPDYKKPYNNLGQGTYTFKVWGKDYLGNITGPVSINFKIRPAPWHTWWAYSGYFMILVGGTYLVYKRNLKVLEKRNKLLESKVIERTNELDNKNKLLAENVDQLEIAKQEVDNKNVELDKKNEELAEKLDLLDKKNEELIKSHKELEESYKQAEKIFSALAEALPGTVLDDKYRLENKIGSGGFGAVYRATHLVLNHFVAVKVFSPTANNATTESLDRFRLEGISACRVNHPNAISVLDFGVSSEGIAYLVMELLNGYTLEDEIKKEGKLSLERVSKIIIPVCDVLFKAHENSIIHRDIKASNIFLHNSGAGEVVKVLDFGIAKLTGDSKEFEKLTITGNILGTPVYMAPERLSSKPYDGKSDVYSLGILLYEMLCGHPPFSSSNFDLMALILAHVKETPKPLRNFDPSIPEDIENLVLKTLSKDPNLRPTAKELAENFAKILGIECNLISTNVLQHTYEGKNTKSKSTATQELETLKFEPDTQK